MVVMTATTAIATTIMMAATMTVMTATGAAFMWREKRASMMAQTWLAKIPGEESGSIPSRAAGTTIRTMDIVTSLAASTNTASAMPKPIARGTGKRFAGAETTTGAGAGDRWSVIRCQ